MIIAELCQNHLGDMKLLEEMVYQASLAGATFCKIQTFFADDLAVPWSNDYHRLKKAELSFSQHSEFVSLCKKYGVTPITSVYTHNYAGDIQQAGFNWIKIGSGQADDIDLIKFYMLTGFKVIVSTGGHELSKLPRLGPLSGVLHCVSQYPASPYDTNLLRMIEIKKFYPNTPFGFSSHVDPYHKDWFIPLELASYLGATFIEVHFTVLPKDQTKDGPVSLDVHQLKHICEFDKKPFEEKKKAMGWFGTIYSPQTQEEKDLIRKYSERWKKS